MLRENKAFDAVLKKIGQKAKDEIVFQEFVLEHKEEGENQMFLTSYAQKLKQENVDLLFRYPVRWDNISILAAQLFKVEFDELEFEALLTKIKVSRSYKKGIEVFTYRLFFEKDFEKDIDSNFAFYLNQKQMNDNGKKSFILYSVYLTPVEEAR